MKSFVFYNCGASGTDLSPPPRRASRRSLHDSRRQCQPGAGKGLDIIVVFGGCCPGFGPAGGTLGGGPLDLNSVPGPSDSDSCRPGTNVRPGPRRPLHAAPHWQLERADHIMVSTSPPNLSPFPVIISEPAARVTVDPGPAVRGAARAAAAEERETGRQLQVGSASDPGRRQPLASAARVVARKAHDS